MSWNLTIDPQTPPNAGGMHVGEHIEAAVMRFARDYHDQHGRPLRMDPATRESVDAAWRAALALIESGAVGDPYKTSWRITLSGHANTDHQPADGWANDQIGVNVAQMTP